LDSANRFALKNAFFVTGQGSPEEKLILTGTVPDLLTFPYFYLQCKTSLRYNGRIYILGPINYK
jgi:hypothetical protein